MRAIILSAGLGTRLRPLTDHTPKPLVPVAGRAMMSYVLDELENAGYTEVLVNVHYLADQLEAFVDAENKRRKSLRLFVQDERKAILGSGGAIAQGASWLFAHHSRALAFNADSLMRPNLADLMHIHEQLVDRHRVLCTLAVLPHPEAGRRYTGLVVADHLVSGFVPADPAREQNCLHFPGVYCLEKDAVQYLEAPGTPCSIKEKLWLPLVRERRLGAWNYLGEYRDLGTVEDLKAAEELLAKLRIQSSSQKVR